MSVNAPMKNVKFDRMNVNEAMKNLKIEGTTIIRNREDAKRIVDILKTLPDRIHAWDTETINIDPKEQSPVGNGTIICA